MCSQCAAHTSTLLLEAPAKINLSLQIVSRRPDGYHELRSFMQKLDLCDLVQVTRTEHSGIQCHSHGRSIPGDEKNIVVLAAEKYQQTTGMAGGIAIDLEKKIPVAAGLGGGSSDAAAVLLALNRLSHMPLVDEDLLQLGLSLGADVPFFLSPAPAAWAEGVGERLTASQSIYGYVILLVNPSFHVSTRWVYENFQLTPDPMKGKKNSFPDLIDGIPLVNDLATVTMGRYPELAIIEENIYAGGARAVLMSGSGPTMFGLFTAEHKESCNHCRSILSQRYGAENVIMCDTLDKGNSRA